MKLVAKEFEFEVREGTVDDVSLLLSFIHSMAEFEKLEVTATEEILKESLFGDHRAAHTLLAFMDGGPVAYAVYFFTFSTMVGRRGLWLEDLYVHPEFRRKGIGRAFMTYLAELAVENRCARFEWTVLDWNTRAIDFYLALGAVVLDDWRICRLDEAGFTRIARQREKGDGE